MDIKVTYSDYIKSVIAGALIIVGVIFAIGLVSVVGAAPVAIFSLFYIIFLMPVLIFVSCVGYPTFKFTLKRVKSKSYISVLAAMLISCTFSLISFSFIFVLLGSDSVAEKSILNVSFPFILAGIPISFIASYVYKKRQA